MNEEVMKRGKEPEYGENKYRNGYRIADRCCATCEHFSPGYEGDGECYNNKNHDALCTHYWGRELVNDEFVCDCKQYDIDDDSTHSAASVSTCGYCELWECANTEKGD